MSNRNPLTEVAVVVRYTAYAPEPEQRVALMEAFPSFEEAEREAIRLNKLVKDKPDISYFVAPVRYYPQGRNVKEGY